MYSATFIRLIEDEYYDILSLSLEYEKKYGFSLFEKPAAICELVQKFKNWMIMAIRNAEISEKGEWIKPEDAIIKAASDRVEKKPGEYIHLGLVEALQLLNRGEFDGVFGDQRRLTFENALGESVTECKFKVCYSHCRFINEFFNPMGERNNSWETFNNDWSDDETGMPF